MSPSEPWPTLNELIDSNQRLIMFSDDVNNAPPYILEMWAHAVDVHYKAETQADFSCDWFRGEPTTHFYFQSLYFGPPPQLKQRRRNKHLRRPDARLQNCIQLNGKFPNFITVDFFSWEILCRLLMS